MNKLNSITVVLWVSWVIYKFGDIKPSEDYFLFILVCTSILFSVVNFLEFLHKNKKL